MWLRRAGSKYVASTAKKRNMKLVGKTEGNLFKKYIILRFPVLNVTMCFMYTYWKDLFAINSSVTYCSSARSKESAAQRWYVGSNAEWGSGSKSIQNLGAPGRRLVRQLFGLGGARALWWGKPERDRERERETARDRANFSSVWGVRLHPSAGRAVVALAMGTRWCCVWEVTGLGASIQWAGACRPRGCATCQHWGGSGAGDRRQRSLPLHSHYLSASTRPWGPFLTKRRCCEAVQEPVQEPVQELF